MNLSRPSRIRLLGAALMGLVAASTSAVETRIAVLDFELNDLAGITPTPQAELERTASLAPLLRDALSRKVGYEVLPISKDEQTKANAGFGYLYEHPDEAQSSAAGSALTWWWSGEFTSPVFCSRI